MGTKAKLIQPTTRCVRAARSGRIEYDPGELAGSHTRKTKENSGFRTPLPYVFAARRTVGQSDFGGFLRCILKRGLANEVNGILSLPEVEVTENRGRKRAPNALIRQTIRISPRLKYFPKERDGDELLPASGFQCSGIQNVEKERVRWIAQNMAIVPMA